MGIVFTHTHTHTHTLEMYVESVRKKRDKISSK